MNDVLTHQRTLYTSGNPTRRWLHTTRRDRIIEALRRYQPSGRYRSRALEVGPGSGVYLPTLLDLCDRVVAADIESAYLTSARHIANADGRLQVLVDDIARTDLPRRSFNLILCSEVIEHLPESRRAISNLAHLLAPDGVLILSTPQRWSLLETCARVALLPGVIQLTRLVYRESVEPTGHINLLTRKQVLAQIAEAGLEVVESWHTGLYVPILAECGGEGGQRLLARWEAAWGNGWLRGALWTQYYVLRRPSHGNQVAGHVDTVGKR